MASAVRAFLKSLLGIFESAVHAAVAVVIDRAVADVVSVHQIHDIHYRLRIMCCVTVDLYIEDVSSSCESVVRSFDLGLVLRCTFIIYRHVVRIGIVVLVSHARDYAEFLLVRACESASKAFCRCGEDAVIVLVCLAELIDLAAHECHDAESEFLGFC